MQRFVIFCLSLIALSGCKLVSTDLPFTMGDSGAAIDVLSGVYVTKPDYGEAISISFQPSGGMVRTSQGPQASTAYTFGPRGSGKENRGELLVSRINDRKDLFVLSVDAALAQVKKNGVWEADTASPNNVFIASRKGKALNIYGLAKEAFTAPLDAPSVATSATNAGVAKRQDMKAFLANLDYDALLASAPLFVLTPAEDVSLTGLLHRNIPNARKIYEDESGAYYGTYMTFRDDIAFPSNKADQFLYVYGERKPLANGAIVDISPVTVQDSSGRSLAGYSYGASEITRMTQHIIPALKRAFPNEKAIEKDVMVRLFLDGYHGRLQGAPYGASQGERAHLRLRFIRRGGAYRPEYENLGKKGWPLNGFLNSPAQIKAAFPVMEAQVVEARMKNRALYLEFAEERTQFKAKNIDNILATMTKKRRPGIVYKTTAFWNQYPNFDDVRDVFDGNFDLIDHIGNFGSAYETFARMYDAQCRQHLVDPIKRTVTTWKEDEWGTPYDGDKYHYYIDARFYDYFDKMAKLGGQKLLGNVVSEVVDGFKNGDVLAAIANSFAAGMMPFVEDLTMRRFIYDHGCLSAPVQQLLDNFVAAPRGDLPVQYTRKIYPGAAQASKPYVLADATRLYNEDREKSIREFKAGRTPLFGDRVIRPYQVGKLANDIWRVNNAMNKIGRSIQETAHPVLTCYYGPTRRTDTGVFMYETMKYWYKSKPADWPAFVAAASGTDDIYPGLQHALQKCPGTLADAQALTGTISPQWQ